MHAPSADSIHRHATLSRDAIASSETPGWPLWRRWVIANSLGESIGLGLVASLGWLVALSFGSDPRGGAAVAFAGAIIALGALEGFVVGALQWLALRSSLPTMEARAWIRATIMGAVVAWILGMLPSTVMSFVNADSAGGAAEDPGSLMRYGAAIAMGLLGGPVLAAFQWRVLRRHVPDAIWWLPANALAWAIAMPMVFALAHAAASYDSTVKLVSTAALCLAATGAVVGSIHGVALVALVRRMRRAGALAD